MLGTRPNIAFAVTQMAKFASNLSDEHLNRAMYILCYLVGTRDYALVFDGNSDAGLSAYYDSSYGIHGTLGLCVRLRMVQDTFQ